MTKLVDDSVLDAALDRFATATVMHACSAAPANQAGIAAVSLADTPMSGADFTNSNGDVSGRKVTVAAKSGVTVDNNGTADHVALSDGTTLLGVTEIPSPQVLTAGNTLNYQSWAKEIRDPT